MLGLIGLIGIAVNNTILLVDFANQERDLGHDRRTAISTAVRKRFRPLVATSFTTVGGVLHGFTGSIETANRAIGNRLAIGMGKAINWSSALIGQDFYETLPSATTSVSMVYLWIRNLG